MENRYKIIALFGQGGSGKDFIQKWMIKNIPDTKSIVSCTTRPKRQNEVKDVDYHFISIKEFTEKIIDGSMLEAVQFNDWFYGTPSEEIVKNKINIGIFNIQGIECLLENDSLEVLPIYITCSAKVRLLRCLNREDSPNCHEICRRFLEDEKDFSDISFDYATYFNDSNYEAPTIERFLPVVKFING